MVVVVGSVDVVVVVVVEVVEVVEVVVVVVVVVEVVVEVVVITGISPNTAKFSQESRRSLPQTRWMFSPRKSGRAYLSRSVRESGRRCRR